MTALPTSTAMHKDGCTTRVGYSPLSRDKTTSGPPEHAYLLLTQSSAQSRACLSTFLGL